MPTTCTTHKTGTWNTCKPITPSSTTPSTQKLRPGCFFLEDQDGELPQQRQKWREKDGEESDLGLPAPKEKDKQVLEENLLQFGDSLPFKICS
jgi:hypothetical protein